jgi:hypothetical protein
MVMEHPPSPQCVGREFVRQYYTLLNQAPAHLHRWEDNVFHIIYALEYNISVALEDSVHKLGTLFGKFSNMDSCFFPPPSWIVFGNVILHVFQTVLTFVTVYSIPTQEGMFLLREDGVLWMTRIWKVCLFAHLNCVIFVNCWEEIHASRFLWQCLMF